MAVSWRRRHAEWEFDTDAWSDDDGGLSDIDDEAFARAIREGRTGTVLASSTSRH